MSGAAGSGGDADNATYLPIELNQNLDLDSVGSYLSRALTLAGVRHSGVERKDKDDDSHLNSFWYKARWGSLVSSSRGPPSLG